MASYGETLFYVPFKCSVTKPNNTKAILQKFLCLLLPIQLQPPKAEDAALLTWGRWSQLAHGWKRTQDYAR